MRSMPRQGLAAMISCLAAHEKTALTAARTWLASTGASMRLIIALTSARLMLAACSFAQRGSAWRRISLSACAQLLFRRFA